MYIFNANYLNKKCKLLQPTVFNLQKTQKSWKKNKTMMASKYYFVTQ